MDGKRSPDMITAAATLPAQPAALRRLIRDGAYGGVTSGPCQRHVQG